MLLIYSADEQERVSMQLIPLVLRDRRLQKEYTAEPLVQIHARGDQLTSGYGNGHTLACTTATDAMKYVSQKKDGNTIITTISDGNGRTVRHRVCREEGLEALRVSAQFENTGAKPVTLNLLSSLNLSGITPFTEGDAAGALVLHRIRSMWSAEGRLQSETIEEAMLERYWTGHALRLCKFGQKGSMPEGQNHLTTHSTPKKYAWMAANSRRGYWFTVETGAMKRAMTNERLASAGFFDLSTAYESIQSDCIGRAVYRTVRTVR